MTIEEIRNKIRQRKYSFSDHSVKRMIKRNVTRQEVESTILTGEIIEEYPDDKYSPSCLIYGKTEYGRDLHVQISLSPIVVIITVYEPDREEWVDCKIRR
ncbi:MAG: DUF4258 domain-containing protein [Proteobacteria bacterium]|nr:DUF4258 domain-containing protein [Pseudomonadota bacterium]